MNSDYSDLLDACLLELRAKKSRGEHFVAMPAETWSALNSRVRPKQAAAPVHPAKSRETQSVRIESPPSSAPVPPKVVVPPTAREFSTAFTPVKFPASSSEAKSAAIPLSQAEKFEALQTLKARALACTQCEHLANSRTQVVFGIGDINAKLMFVGEAPGADEDLEGEPFVGRAGQLLTKIIETMGLSRDRVYIANILKCRPDTPGQTSGNRKPTPVEMATCKPYLIEQINLIQPQVLVALGASAVEGLFGGPVFITKLRGHWKSYQGIPLMPTYHPSYVARNQTMQTKREIWEDMMAVMERLGMPVSAKKRGFFLA